MYAIVTDASANLPTARAAALGVTVVPFSYYIDGDEHTCLDTEAFRADVYYRLLNEKVEVKTSQITPARVYWCCIPTVGGRRVRRSTP